MFQIVTNNMITRKPATDNVVAPNPETWGVLVINVRPADLDDSPLPPPPPMTFEVARAKGRTTRKGRRSPKPREQVVIGRRAML
jgi:hypothetical protein